MPDADDTTAVSEALFASILDVAVDAIIVASADQRILHFNRGAAQIFGYLPEDAIGRPLTDLLPERFRRAHGVQVEGFGTGPDTARLMGERREIYGRRKDGEEFPAEASISKLDTRDGVVYTVVLRDVTERAQRARDERFLVEAGAALGTSLDVTRTLQSLVNAGVPYLAEACVVDVEGVDGVWQREVSRNADSAVQTLLDAMTADVLSWDHPWRAIDVMRTGRGEVVATVTDDWLEAHSDSPEQLTRLRALKIRAVLLLPLIVRDQVLGVLTMFRLAGTSFTPAQFALAQELASRAAFALDNARMYTIARRASRAREDVLSVVSHDLGNPLAAIRLCAAALLQSPPSDLEEGRQLVQAIGNSADWMSRLLRDLLDVSTIEVGRLSIERRTEQLGPIVEQAMAMVAPQADERGVTLRADVADGVPAVHGDAARLVQVLTNLLGNSLKYTARGGSVTVHAAPRGDTVIMTVRDTGSGIPADVLPRIFERYYTRKRAANAAGSGLGLAIVRGIVEAHGGHVWVESVEGLGSTFFVALPAAK